ncbi:hypothetical protein [Staphylococcus aureus]
MSNNIGTGMRASDNAPLTWLAKFKMHYQIYRLCVSI